VWQIVIITERVTMVFASATTHTLVHCVTPVCREEKRREGERGARTREGGGKGERERMRERGRRGTK
jgi:hypothetical protein